MTISYFRSRKLKMTLHDAMQQTEYHGNLRMSNFDSVGEHYYTEINGLYLIISTADNIWVTDKKCDELKGGYTRRSLILNALRVFKDGDLTIKTKSILDKVHSIEDMLYKNSRLSSVRKKFDETYKKAHKAYHIETNRIRITQKIESNW